MSTTTPGLPTEIDPLIPEDFIVAITYIVLSLSILPVYLRLIYIFLTDKEFKKSNSYKLFVNLGIFDCLQLCLHWTAGALVLYPHACTYPYLCKFLGATLNSAWIGLFPATVTISAQRLMIIARKMNSEGVIPWILKGMLLAGWSYTGVFYVILLTVATVSFNPEGYCWSYADDFFSKIMSQVEIVVSLSLGTISFIIYLIIIVHIVYLKSFTSQSISSRTNKRERRILVQSVILFVNLALIILIWHYYTLILPNKRETVFVINCYWMTYCSLNPILYLTMNSKIRKRFVEVIYKSQTHPLPDLLQTSSTPGRK